ncbi:coiled-coil domain-containing protein mad1 [Cryptotrichosporon argae]
MDRQIPSSLSRLPRPATSFASPVPASSTLGKRPAETDSEIIQLRRQLSAARAKLHTYERDVLRLQNAEAAAAQTIEEQRVRIEVLSGERHVLLDGENSEKTRGKEREEEWGAERAELVKKVSDLRRLHGATTSSLAEAESTISSLTLQHATLSRESKTSISMLEGRVAELERENRDMRNWEHRAKALSIQLEEERRRADEGARKREEGRADERTDQKIRDEFRRQSQNFRDWQQTQGALQAEVAELRRWKKDAEVAERAARETERALRDDIAALHFQLERARRDVDSLTQSFSSLPSSPVDVATLQSRLSALSARHTETTADLAAKTRECDALHARLSALSVESRTVILDLTRRSEDAEREARWAKEGRRGAEQREELMRVELDALRTSLNTAAAEGTVDQTARVAELERLLDTYKAQLDEIARDSRKAEERLVHGAGLVQMAELEAAVARADASQKDVDALNAALAELQTANDTLHVEVSDLMRRLASGEFNPAYERCLELRGNPAAKAQAVRQAMLDELRGENAALLDRLAKVDRAGGEGGDGFVPRESWDRLVREKEEMEAAHAKRLLRLKEIFGSKSREFLESVYSLLGWRIKFDESGADIRLTSMYAPRGKMGLTLKFASHEGHFGTMQMSGGMARSLEEARHFWVVERQSIPGFLAQVTTEMFEKTTIGRAAGYVGLE